MKRNIVALLMAIVLLSSIISLAGQSPVVSPAQQTSQKVFETGDLAISVPTSQVPFYFFWNVDDNTTIYRVHFDTMFEINDLNDNGIYDQQNDTLIAQSVTPLSQLTWEMSSIEETTDGTAHITSFNLTGYVTGTNPHVTEDLVVQFNNHIIEQDGHTEVKFDVLIFNYSWVSVDSLLVLGFKITTADPTFGDPQLIKTQLQTRAQFGDAYMDSVSEASSGASYKHQVAARVSVGSRSALNTSDISPRVYITYSHFDGDLRHDPTIGILQASEHTYVADGLTIKVPTTQVPFYFFWRTGDVETTYRVAFDTMFEIIDSNGNEMFDPTTESLVPNSVFPLALLNWEMSDLVNETDKEQNTILHFNLTGIPSNSPQVGDTFIQFRNHIALAGNETSLKFDVVIENYEWTNSASNVMLVLGYKLSTTDHLYNGTPSHNSSAVVFGNAYMNAVSTAFANQGSDTIQVAAALSVGLGSKVDSTDTATRIYLSYAHFDGNLTHDPTLGLLATADTIDSSTTGEPTSTDGTSSIPLVAGMIMVALVVPVIVRRKYQ